MALRERPVASIELSIRFIYLILNGIAVLDCGELKESAFAYRPLNEISRILLNEV